MTDTISTLAQKLRPHWLRDLGNGSGGIIAAGGGGMTVHTLSGSYHTGELDPSQAPWAVTDTELANHAALPDAHHAAATVVSPLAITGQQIRIANGSAQYQILVTGATPFAPAYAGLSTFAGNGLDFTGGKFIVGQGAGLTVSATTVALTTPGTLTVATANSASGSHTHAVTSSSNPGAAAAILATTGAGALTLKTLTVSDFLYVDGTIDFGTNTLYEDATYLQVAGSKPIRFGQNIGNANWTVYNAGGADFGGSVNITGNSNLYVSGTVGGAAGVLQTLNDRVGILCVPDPQFALDVAGPARAQYFIGPHAIQLKDALLIAHYDGPDPSSVVGEPNGHFGQVGTIAGGVAFRPGKFNKALQVAPAGQNDVGNSRPNPSGSTTGWHGHAYDMSGSLSPASVTAANAPFVGSKAIGVTYTYSLASVVDFTARAGTYTLTAWVRVVGRSDATISLGMGWGGTGGSIDYIWTPTTLASAVDGQWYQLRFTAPSTTVAATRGVVVKALVPTSGSYRLEVANVQAELSSFPTPYMDGDMGDGYAWAGTAYASASTRTVGSLSYTGLPVQWRALTMMGWVRLETTAAAAGRGLAVGEIRIDNSNRYALYFDNGTDRLQAYLTASTSTTLTSSTAAAAQTWHHVAVTVNGTAAALFLNGAQVASGTLANAPAGLATAYVGTSGLVTPLNGMVDDFALINRALTAMDVRAVYESDAPVFAESSVWSFRATPTGLVWADENGLWMRDTGGNAVLGVYGGAAGAYSWGGQSLDTGDLLIGRANAYVLWDNSAATLEVAGSIKATAGYIGGTTTGWAITAGKLSSANITLLADPANASILVGSGAALGGGLYGLGGLTTGAAAGDTVLWLGKLHVDRATAPFRVTLAGALTATNAVITGSITATSGSITGTLTIGISGKITAGSTEISSSGILLPRTTITQGDDVFDSPDLTPGVSLTTRYSDTAATWNGADGTYNYAGNTVMRLYSSSVHYVDGGLIGGLWAHALDGVIEAPAPAVPANSGSWMRRLWLLAGAKFLTVGTGGVANGVGVNVYNPQKALHVGGTLLIDGDEGGYFNTVGLTNVTDTSVSTGTGTVKMNSTTARNSDAWIKVYIGTTAYWIPAWSNIN